MEANSTIYFSATLNKNFKGKRAFSLSVVKYSLSVIAFVLITLFFSEQAFSQVSFQPVYAISPSRNTAPNVVAIGDVNNDQLNDVVMVTGSYNDPTYDRKLFVYPQTSLGTLGTPTLYEAYNGAGAVYIADFNSDGLNDVVISFSDSIGIYFQNSGGTLNPVQKYYVGATVSTMTIGDVNHDGLTDIIVSCSDSLRIYYQQNGGGFNKVTYATYGGGYTVLRVGDMNYDGLPDVVGRRGGGPAGIDIYTQNNSGLLNPYIYTSAPSSNQSGLGIGDLNNDGRNDAVTGVFGNRPNSDVQLWFQDTTTHLLQTTPTTVPDLDEVQTIDVTDLDCDGKNEIIVVNGGWGNITVFSQDGSNQYEAWQQSPPANYPTQEFSMSCGADWFNYQAGMAIGDINNDGKKDIVLAATYIGSSCNGVLVFLNNSPCGPVTLTASDTVQNASCQNKSDGTATAIVNTGTGPYHYLWNTVPPQTTPTATGLSAGNYYVTITDANSNTKVLSIAITAPTIVPASVTITTPSNSLCGTNSASFTATGVNGGNNPTYYWTINGVHQGLDSYHYAASGLQNNDTVVCVMTSDEGCVSGSPATSNTIIMTIGNNGVAGTVTSARDTLCEGTNTSLSAQGSSGSPYQWQSSATPSPANFGNISGADSSTYTTASLSQTTYYRLIVGNGKCADTSVEYSLVVVPSPAVNFNYTSDGLKVTFKPIDTAGGVVLYSWNFGDASTSSQPSPVHTFNTTGTYDVCLTVYNGSNCSYTDCENIDVELTGIVSVNQTDYWNIYPNPFDDYVNISFGKDNTAIKSIELYDLTGRKIYSKLFDGEANSLLQVNLPGLAQGAYYLRIETNDTNYLQPLIKQ